MQNSSDNPSLPASDPVLIVDKVSKRYEIYERPQDRLKQSLIPRLQKALPVQWRRREPFFTEFWALRDVSLQLQRGDALGILGRNGAGKSTLLQIIAGTLSPTAGSISANGKIAALLELGSGFSPDFTGRENVKLNATLLGLTATEIDQRFEAIAQFADIGDFMDQPVKTYSSGMMMRLAFAVQTAVEPALLIVDEALAVGDARFQKKCFSRLEQLRASGTTILFVTHDTGTILLFCTRAMILEHGVVHAAGDPQRIAREYHKLLFGSAAEQSVSLQIAGPGHKATDVETAPNSSDCSESTVLAAPILVEKSEREVRYGSKEAEIYEIGLRDALGANTRIIETRSSCEAYFRATVRPNLLAPIGYGFIISNARGIEVYGTKSGLYSNSISPPSTGALYECRLKFVVRLVPGRYFLTAALAHEDERANDQFLDFRFDAFEFEVMGPTRTFTTSLTDLDAELSHVEVAYGDRESRCSSSGNDR